MCFIALSIMKFFCEIFVISMEFLSFNYLFSNELQCISQVIIMLGMKYNDFLLKISGHLEDILYSFVGNLSSDIPGGDTPGTSGGYPGDIRGTSVGHPRDIRGTFSDLSVFGTLYCFTVCGKKRDRA